MTPPPASGDDRPTSRRRRTRAPSNGGWRPLPPDGGYEPVRVGDNLDAVARRLGMPAASSLGVIFGRWEHVVGAVLAAHTRPVNLADGTLVVSVDAPAWATQLKYLSSTLLVRLSEAAGPDVVRRIDVRVEAPRRR